MRASILTQKRARALRRKMTLPEILLWQELRGRKLNDLFFRNQHTKDPYVLDFYFARAKLAVEVDGISHEGRAKHDARRDAWLAEQGIRTLRIPAVDILRDGNLGNMLATIERAAVSQSSIG